MRNLTIPRVLTTLSTAAILATAACKKDKKEDPTPAPIAFQLNGSAPSGPTGVEASYIDRTKELCIHAGADTTQTTHPWSLSICLDSVTAPGTFTTGMVRYTTYFNWTSWSSLEAGGSSQIAITRLDLTNNRVSGTFSATMPPVASSGATGTKTISNGTFTDVLLRHY